VALGSVDGVITVWRTDQPRPLVVVRVTVGQTMCAHPCWGLTVCRFVRASHSCCFLLSVCTLSKINVHPPFHPCQPLLSHASTFNTHHNHRNTSMIKSSTGPRGLSRRRNRPGLGARRLFASRLGPRRQSALPRLFPARARSGPHPRAAAAHRAQVSWGRTSRTELVVELLSSVFRLVGLFAVVRLAEVLAPVCLFNARSLRCFRMMFAHGILGCMARTWAPWSAAGPTAPWQAAAGLVPVLVR